MTPTLQYIRDCSMTMKKKSVVSSFIDIVPVILSGFVCLGLIFLLYDKSISSPNFEKTLETVSPIFIAISGIVSITIMGYLAFRAMSLKGIRASSMSSLSEVTQKMHHFRNILLLLLRSKMWLPGLKEYIDDEFEGLNFFEVKEFYKGKSKLAIEFLQESHHYGDTENLYLEMKSLLMTSTKDKNIPENINFPNVYNREIVDKWLQHKCGSGLWYYFGYKFADYKESLDIEAVFERHQEKIMTLAHSIDANAFEDSSFNEVFLSRLGEYMSKEVLPKLYELQGPDTSRLPASLRYVYLIFLLFVFFGVLLPLLSLMLSLPALALIVGFSVIISSIFFIAISLYPFLRKEIIE